MERFPSIFLFFFCFFLRSRKFSFLELYPADSLHYPSRIFICKVKSNRRSLVVPISVSLSLIFVSLTLLIFRRLVRILPPRLSFVYPSPAELLVDDHGTTTTRGTQSCAFSRTHPRVVLLSFHLAFTAFAHSPHSTIPEEIRGQNIRDEVLLAANMSSARPTSATAHRAQDGSGTYLDPWAPYPMAQRYFLHFFTPRETFSSTHAFQYNIVTRSTSCSEFFDRFTWGQQFTV